MNDRFGQDRDPTGGEAMASAGTVGDLLRAERQRRGWTLADAEIYLKIRRSMLEAIEQGRFDLLPGRAYALAFARTYAEFLGLDAEEIVERCRVEMRGGGEPKSSGTAAGGLLGDIDLARVGLAAAAVVGVILAGLWMFDGGSDEANRRVEASAPQVLPPREPATAAAQQPSVATGPGTAAAMPPPPPPAPTAGSAPAANAQGASPSALPPGSGTDPTSAQAAGLSTQTAQAPPGARNVAGGSRISLKANGDTWVEIRDPAGASVLARVLRNGEVYNVPDRPGLILSSGRITTIEVRVDGQVVPPQGRTRREMSLDPSRLLQAAQVPAADPAAQQGQQNQATPARPRRAPPPAGPIPPVPPGTPGASGN